MTGNEQWETPPDHFGSDTDEWATPPSLLRPLADAVGGFDLDPCSGAEEKSIAAETYTAEDDGLTSPWSGIVWCNPPYSEMEAWMRRAVDQSNREETHLILVLAPARTSTQWFHDYAVEADLLVFLEGRLTFGNPREQVRNAPFPSLIAAFGDVPSELVECLDRRGAIYDQGSLRERTEQKQLATDGGKVWRPQATGKTAQDHAEKVREDGEDPTEVVYYTTYSDRYHTHPECPHLEGSDRVWYAGSLYLLSTMPEPYCTGPKDTLHEVECCSWCEENSGRCSTDSGDENCAVDTVSDRSGGER